MYKASQSPRRTAYTPGFSILICSLKEAIEIEKEPSTFNRDPGVQLTYGTKQLVRRYEQCKRLTSQENDWSKKVLPNYKKMLKLKKIKGLFHFI